MIRVTIEIDHYSTHEIKVVETNALIDLQDREAAGKELANLAWRACSAATAAVDARVPS